MYLLSSLAWAGLLTQCVNVAYAVPYKGEVKDVVIKDHDKRDVVIEAGEGAINIVHEGSGDINIVINQVAATTATVTTTVPGCGGSTSAPAIADGRTSYTNSSSGPPPDNTMHPVLPGGQGYAHPSACAPQPSATMWYGSDGNTDNSGKSLVDRAILEIPSLTYPAVNAHQVDSIVSVTCQGNSATVKFSTSQAYDVAANSWKGLFTIISYSDTCGTGMNGEHDFILVTGVVKGPDGSLTLICTIQYISFEHAVGKDTNMTVTVGYNNTTPNTGNNTSPNKPKQSFPGTCLGEDFDNKLDDAGGDTISLADPNFWDSVAPSTTADDWGGDFSTDDLADVDDQNFDDQFDARRARLRRRNRTRRSIHKRDILDWGKRKFRQAATAVKTIVVNTASAAYNRVKTGLQTLLDVVDDWTSVDKEKTVDLGFNNYPSNGVSPFRNQPGFKFYDNGDLTAWCVQCGAQSTLQAVGRITFSIANGFTQGNVRLFGRLEAGVFLGLDGKVAKTIPIAEQTFVQLTLGDALLPGILKLGPSVRVGAGASVGFEANGQLYAGAKARWENVNVILDVIDTARSGVTGLIPAIDPEFEINGNVQITLDGHLTLAVGLTVGLLNDKFSRSVEVIDQPGLQVTAGIAGSVAFNNGFSAAFTGDCAGIALGAFVYNNVTADLAKITTRTLFAWKSPSYTKCFPLGGSNAALDNGSEDATNDSDGDGFADGSTADDGAADGDGAAAKKRDLPIIQARPRSVHGVKRSPLKIAGARADGVVRAPVVPELQRRQGFSNATGSVNANDTNNSAFSRGTSFAPMVTIDGDLELHWSQSGNVYVIESNGDTDTANQPDGEFAISTADETGLFGAILLEDSNIRVITGDGDGGMFHGYIDELDKYGVSRLRSHSPDFLPRQSRVVVFAAVNDESIPEDGRELLAAIDTADNLYYPVVCLYQDCFPKVFLAKDPEQGPLILQNLTEITGEANLDCAVLPLTAASLVF